MQFPPGPCFPLCIKRLSALFCCPLHTAESLFPLLFTGWTDSIWPNLELFRNHLHPTSLTQSECDKSPIPPPPLACDRSIRWTGPPEHLAFACFFCFLLSCSMGPSILQQQCKQRNNPFLCLLRGPHLTTWACRLLLAYAPAINAFDTIQP